MNGREIAEFRGKPLEEHTKQELIDIINEMYASYEKREIEKKRQLKILRKFK